MLFERCYLGAVAIGLVNIAVAWKTTMARLAEQPAAAQLGPAFAQSMLIGTTVLSIAISLLLWYFTARKASVVTKWIVTAFFVLGVMGYFVSALQGTMEHGIGGILVAITWIVNAAAVWQLFKPDSKLWFGEETV